MNHKQMFAALVLLSAFAAACSFFTPQRDREIVDIGCVIAHYELPDSTLAGLCGLLPEQVATARTQAVRSAAAAAEHPAVAKLGGAK